jgi:hypothetical protein
MPASRGAFLAEPAAAELAFLFSPEPQRAAPFTFTFFMPASRGAEACAPQEVGAEALAEVALETPSVEAELEAAAGPTAPPAASVSGRGPFEPLVFEPFLNDLPAHVPAFCRHKSDVPVGCREGGHTLALGPHRVAAVHDARRSFARFALDESAQRQRAVLAAC